MFRAVLLTALVSAVSALDCSFQGETQLPGDLLLRQIVNQVDKTVTVELTYPGQGWLSLGFSNTGMIGATTVVGLPAQGTVEKYLMTGKTPDQVNPTTTNPTLTDASIVQTATETVLTYTKPLVEEGELTVEEGAPNTIIYAVGSDSNWGSAHRLYGSFTLDFDTCVEPPQLDCAFQGETQLPDGLTLNQIINQVDKTVTIELKHAGQGWLSLGFSNTGMIGATTVVGLPESGIVEKYRMTGKVPEAVNAIGNATLTDVAIEEVDGETILTYTKPLVEEGELAVAEGSNTIIFAVGSGTAWGTPHSKYGSFTVDFNTCVDLAKQDLAASPTASPVVAGDLDCSLYRNLDIVEGVLSLREVVNPVNDTVTMELTYSGQGWVALAFSSSGFMVGTTAMVGLPDANTVEKYFLGGKNPSNVRLVPEEQQTLTNTTIMQNDTHTVMQFTKPLVEPGELSVSPDGVNRVIFATGPSNDLYGALHDEFGAFELTLTSCIPAGTAPGVVNGGPVNLFNNEVPNESIWKVHGFFMAIAWGLLVPLAVGASLCRNLLPSGLWFVLHRGLNGLALLFNLVGFSLAVHLINDAATPGQDPEHFQFDKHRTIGLVVFVAAMLQAGFAFVRPSHHHAPTDTDNKNETNHTQNGAEANSGSETDSGDTHEGKKPMLRFLWECKHRTLGVGLIALSWFNVHTGIDLYIERFGEGGVDPAVAFWGVAGGATGLIGVAALLAKNQSS